MKPILRNKKKFSVKLKLLIGLSFFLIALLFFISLKFSGNLHKDRTHLELSEILAVPECSVSSGFYFSSVSVQLSNKDPYATIYYTTDGSEPSLTSQKYTGAIEMEDQSDNENNLAAIPTSPRWKPPLQTVFKGRILRAIASDGKKKSKELVRSFFITPMGRKRYALPVVSLVINEKDFFGYKNGIYVLGKSYDDKDNYIRKNIPLDLPWWEYPSNYLLKGEDMERPVFIEFIRKDGQPGFGLQAGVRINGNATRGFSQKSLRISFRKKYGPEELHYPIFSGNPVTTFHSFILRNAGNDWDKTMFRDAFMQSLMKDSKLDIQDDQPAIVFLNGEYWGIHNIRERFDERYISNKYQLPADSITLLEYGGQLIKGRKEDEKAFAELLEFVEKNDMSKDTNYEFVESRIDLMSFMEFVIANIYFCNSDWPYNNVKFWRYQATAHSVDNKPADGRWRWMLCDTDWGFGYNSSSTPETDLLEKATTVGSVGILFHNLLRNKKFTNAFLSRVQFHLNTNFKTSYVLSRIQEFESVLEPEITEHISRWRAIGSYSQWKSNVEVMKDFAKKRPACLAHQLNQFFGLNKEQQISVEK